MPQLISVFTTTYTVVASASTTKISPNYKGVAEICIFEPVGISTILGPWKIYRRTTDAKQKATFVGLVAF